MTELSVKEWLLELAQGLEFRRKFGLEDSWPQLEALYYNVEPSQDWSCPNLISSTGDTLLSTLTVPTPYVTVKSRRGDAIFKARVVESVDNALITDLKIPHEVEQACLHAYLWGRGFLKIGYDSEYGWAPEHDIGGQKDPVGMTLTMVNQKGQRLEFGNARPGMPWVQSCLPHDIVVPWGTQTLETARWIAHRVVRHIEEVKADDKYDNTSNLQPVMSMEDFIRSYNSNLKPYRSGEILSQGLRESSGNVEFCELWEIHDRQTGKIYVIATGYDKRFLRNEKNLLQLSGLPFVSLGFVPGARTLWTTSDAYYLRAHQAEAADISIQSAKQRRLSTLKFLYEDGAIAGDELETLLSSRVGAAVKVNAGRMVNAVQPFQPGGNYTLYQEQELTRRNAREAVGFSRNQIGEFEASGRRTATEAQIVDQASTLRLSRRQLVIRDAYVRAFEIINPILFKYWTAPRQAKVLDPEMQARWVSFTGEDLEGLYAYDIGFSAAPGDTLQGRRAQALQLFGMLAQDPTVDPVELRRYLINAFNDPEFSKVFNPEIWSLEAQQRAQLQLQMSQMQPSVRPPQAGGEMPPQGAMPQMQGLGG
jgi:hypothetical protein